MTEDDDMPNPPDEPALAAGEIQAASVPGFLKPFMAVVALAIDDADAARRWLRTHAGRFTTLEEAFETRKQVRLFRQKPVAEREGQRVPPDLDDAWVNVGFSYAGMQRLLWGTPFWRDLDRFKDEAFRAGLAQRSAYLGDPTDPNAEGHPLNWKVGAPGKEPHVVLLFAADKEPTLQTLLEEITEGCGGLTEVYREIGNKHGEHGYEHFGFQDGVSQPGVRGTVGGDFLTPRTLDASQIPDAWLYGMPGQYLVWPGEFVFGYPGAGADPLLPGNTKLPGPPWSENGSYCVFRRLRQDVKGFWAFLTDQAEQLATQPGFEGIDADWLGAHIVGRWKSGAPVARTPGADVEALGFDRLANNNFEFDRETPDPPLEPPYETRYYEQVAGSDPVGLTCPLAAHIRKVNARASANDMGGRRASFNRRILRRALPYGEPLPDPTGPDPQDGDRGLLFVCFQSSIVDQFEFLCNAWMGSPTNPRSPSGFDMMIGQNGMPGKERARSATVFGAKLNSGTVKTMEDYVIPTGGGYFFTPSISALRHVIAAGTGAPPLS